MLLGAGLYLWFIVFGTFHFVESWALVGFSVYFVHTLELASIYCYCCIMLSILLCVYCELWDQVTACGQPHVQVVSSARYLGSVSGSLVGFRLTMLLVSL